MEHQWTLDGVQSSKVATKVCPHCKLAGIPSEVELCPQCGYSFKQEKLIDLPGTEGEAPAIISHDKSAEMARLDPEKWREYQRLLGSQRSYQAFNWLIATGSSPAELTLAVTFCRKQDGSRYNNNRGERDKLLQYCNSLG
jgi:hypothetical protein